MRWLIIPVAIVAWSAALAGRAIAADVPDEVAPNRTRLAAARDALLICAVVMGAGALLPWWGAFGIAALIGALRITGAMYWSPAAVGAFALGASATSAPGIIATATIIIIANLLSGALEKSWRAVVITTASQPAGALLVAMLLTLA